MKKKISQKKGQKLRKKIYKNKKSQEKEFLCGKTTVENGQK